MKTMTKLSPKRPTPARQFKYLLKTLSHELRNPLNAIYGMSQILQRAENLDDEIKQSVGIIHQSSRDVLPLLDYISNHLLAEPEKSEATPQPFDFQTLIESMIKEKYEELKDSQIRLFLSYDKNTPHRVTGYAEKIQMVLAFLINNAIRFTERGEIIISVRAQPIPERDQAMFQITIEDSGCGIAAEQLKDIFDLFVAEGDEQKNPGLKLSISRDILGDMGGEIDIQSKVNLGTRVTIEFPLVINEDVQPMKTLWDSYRQNMRVLIIEDNDLIGDTLKNYLGANETTIVSEENALAAIKSAFVQHRPFQMVVIDESILECDVEQISDLLVSFPKHFTPFFIVLGHHKESQRLAMLSQEVTVCRIDKPVLPSTFTKQIALSWCNFKNRNSKIQVNKAFAISPNILLVEDNQNNIAVEKMMLESLGCHVDVALNGDEALDYVRKPANHYHLVLLDIGLPGKQGYEVAPVLKEMASNCVELPIVAMTAYVSDADKAKCYRAGIQDIVAKPATIEILEQKIKQYMFCS